MARFFSIALLMTLVGAGPASAGLVLSTELIASSGTSDVYGVKLVGATDLAVYNVEVVIRAGGLTDESQIAVEPPAAGYVFGDSSLFFAGVNVAGAEVRVTLTDFAAAGVDTIAGANDLLALITIDTSALTGPPSFAFEPDTLTLDDPDGRPIAGYDELTRSLAAVPEPSSLILAALGGIAVLGGAARAARTSRAGT